MQVAAVSRRSHEYSQRAIIRMIAILILTVALISLWRSEAFATEYEENVSSIEFYPVDDFARFNYYEGIDETEYNHYVYSEDPKTGEEKEEAFPYTEYVLNFHDGDKVIVTYNDGRVLALNFNEYRYEWYDVEGTFYEFGPTFYTDQGYDNKWAIGAHDAFIMFGGSDSEAPITYSDPFKVYIKPGSEKHIHNMIHYETLAATCTKAGRIEYWACDGCNKYFSDETGDIELTASELVDADDPVRGHNWGNWVQTKAATCTAKGSKSRTCATCGKKETVEIAAKGHSWNAPTYTWSKDYKTVTATRVCKTDSSHKQTETVKTTSKITKKATYTAKGQTTYTATFKNTAFKKQSKAVTNIAKLPKKANTIKVKTKANTIKFNTLKKKNQTIAVKKAFTVTKVQGKVTYKKISGNGKITVNTAGKITIKKGLKKGTYKVKVRVTAAGNTTYKAATKTVIVTVKVK